MDERPDRIQEVTDVPNVVHAESPDTRPAVMRVEDAARILDIGRGTAYELARRGELPGVIKLGGRYVVSRAILDRVLNGGEE